MLSRVDLETWSKEQQTKAAPSAGDDALEDWSDDSEDEGGSSTDKFVRLDASGKALEDVSVLSHYTALQRLDLSHNKLKELGSVAALGRSLQVLSVAQNPLSSAIGVERLRLLTALDLCDCGLVSLPVLDELHALVTLLLSGNALTALPTVAAADEHKGLQELRLDRNELTTAGPADWMAVRGRHLRTLDLGTKHPAQKKNQKNKDWDAADSTANPLTDDAIVCLLNAVAGCCQRLEILNIPSTGSAGRLSRAERKKRAAARKKQQDEASQYNGGTQEVTGMLLLHALPRLHTVNGYDWVRNIDVAPSAEAAVAKHTGAAHSAPREDITTMGKRDRDAIDAATAKKAAKKSKKDTGEKGKKEKKEKKKKKKKKEKEKREKVTINAK